MALEMRAFTMVKSIPERQTTRYFRYDLVFNLFISKVFDTCNLQINTLQHCDVIYLKTH